MLIGCITGPDLETAKSQIKKANALCDGAELRLDLLQCSIAELKRMVKGVLLVTDQGQTQCSEFTIATYHNFKETPDDLEEILAQMPKADIYKIATFANSTLDSLKMMAFVQNHSNVAGMCMGLLGQITRILSPVVGSKLTFASLGHPASSGQIEVEELLNVYNYRNLNQDTLLYGLIGYPLTHSKGHAFHNTFFRNKGINAVYVKMPLLDTEMDSFFSLIKGFNFRGLSVTIPLKETVVPYCHVLKEETPQIGAVNTLVISDHIEGYNTDGIGALNAIGDVEGKRIVILGAGGAAKAIAFEAQKRGALISLHSRRFNNLDQIPEYDILINATPNPCPIDLELLQPNRIVMDITTKHAGSQFLNHAQSLGCRIIEGKEMFELQAFEQQFRWSHLNPT